MMGAVIMALGLSMGGPAVPARDKRSLGEYPPAATRRVMRIAGWVVVALVVLGGCARQVYDQARATRPYPSELHQTGSSDIQVFRDGSSIELVNATPRSYSDFDLWINQRYVRHVESLPAGGRVRLSLWDFFDERGENPNAGGFWRTEPPTPVELVELQLGDDKPMVGAIAVTSSP